MARNTLGEIAEFIQDHAEATFDVSLACYLQRVGEEHGPWMAHCNALVHTGDAIPCDKYKEALALAVQWLMGRVVDKLPNRDA